MSYGDPANLLVLFDHIDRTEVRKVRHCETGDAGESKCVIQRSSEQRARLGQKSQPLGSLCLRPHRAFAGKEEGALFFGPDPLRDVSHQPTKSRGLPFLVVHDADGDRGGKNRAAIGAHGNLPILDLFHITAMQAGKLAGKFFVISAGDELNQRTLRQ